MEKGASVMEGQTLFNIVTLIAGALGGFVLKAIWDALIELRTSDKNLVEKISAIEILVAGQYVKRMDLDAIARELFAKLDRIDGKLDNKVDMRLFEMHTNGDSK